MSSDLIAPDQATRHAPHLSSYIAQLRALMGSDSVQEMDLFIPPEQAMGLGAGISGWGGEEQFLQTQHWRPDQERDASQKESDSDLSAPPSANIIDLGAKSQQQKQQPSGFVSPRPATMQPVLAQPIPAESRITGVAQNGPAILSFYVNGVLISEGVDIEIYDREVWIPVRSFVQLMDFPIEISQNERSGQGQYSANQDAFAYDLGTGYVVNGFERTAIDPQHVRYVGTHLWLSLPAIESWFLLRANYTPSEQALRIVAPEDLPTVQRLYRAAGIRSSYQSDLDVYEQDAAHGTFVPTPNAMVGAPIIGLSLGAGYQRAPTPQGGFKQDAKGIGTYSFQAASDLIGGTARLGLSGDTETAVRGGRFHMTWRDEAGAIQIEEAQIGQSNQQEAVTHFQIGDIVTVPQGVIASSAIERGVRLNNASSLTTSMRRYGQIYGRAHPTWTVELYRNSILLASQTVDESGEYRFETSFLYSGANEFRLVFRSPQGETYERPYVIPYQSDAFSAGALTYDFTISSQRKRLIPLKELEESSDNSSDEAAEPYPGMRSDDGRTRISAAAQIGVGGSTAATVGIHSHVLNGERDTHASTGLRLRGGLVSAELEGTAYVPGASSVEDGTSAELTLELHPYGQHFSLSGYKSNNMKTALAKDMPEHRVSGAQQFNLTPTPVSYIDVHNRVELDWYESGKSVQNWQPSLGWPIGSGYFLQQFNLIKTRKAKLSPSSVSGSSEGTVHTAASSVSGPIFDGTYRVKADYHFQPLSELETISARYGQQFVSGGSFGVNISRNFKTDIDEIGLNALYRLKSVRMGPSATIKSDDSFSLFWRVRTLVDTGDRGRIQFRAPTVTDSGAISARVYIDANANRRLDAGEPLISGARVSAMQGQQSAFSDRFGVAYLHNIPDATMTDVTIDQSSLHSAYWRVPPVRSVVVRSGHTLYLDFPLQEVSEIRGSLLYEDAAGYHSGQAVSGGAKERNTPEFAPEFSGATMLLLDESGIAVQRVRAAPGGSFKFQSLIPGRYFVALDTESAMQLGVQSPNPQEIFVAQRGRSYDMRPILVHKPRSGVDGDLAASHDHQLPHLSINRQLTDLNALSKQPWQGQIQDQEGFKVEELGQPVPALRDTANGTQSLHVAVEIGRYSTGWARALAWRLLQQKLPNLTAKVTQIPIKPNETKPHIKPWPLVVGIFRDVTQAQIFCERLAQEGHEICDLYPVSADMVGQF